MNTHTDFDTEGGNIDDIDDIDDASTEILVLHCGSIIQYAKFLIPISHPIPTLILLLTIYIIIMLLL